MSHSCPRQQVLPGVWQGIEGQLGVALPADYKEFIEAFGAGTFYQFLQIMGPFPGDANLISWHKKESERYLQHQAYFPLHCPFPLSPSAGGLLAFGGDESGSTLFWKISKKPEEWTIVYYTHDWLDCFEYNCGFDAFMTGWLTRNIHLPLADELEVFSRGEEVFKGPC